MRAEYVFDHPSPAAVRGMSVDELTLLHGNLEGRPNVNKGRSFLNGQVRMVKRELNRRKKLEQRQGPQSDEVTGEIFERLHEVLEPAKLNASERVILLEAHNDDFSMSRLAGKLSSTGVGLTVVTLTDGAARDLRGYSPDELPAERWQEGLAAGDLAGIAQAHRIGLPDGRLSDHADEAGEFLGKIVEEVKPTLIIAPNLLDLHSDHASAHEIALDVAGSEIPVYGMDTVTGIDKYDMPLKPDRYMSLSRKIARLEKQIYLSFKTQVTDLPPDERKDIFTVLGMTKRRGREIGVENAVAIFDPLNTNKNPLPELLGI